MDFLQAVVLSVVEGVTEFLPVSSTGHLILTSDLLNVHQTDFVKSFEIFIQLGAMLSIIFLYWGTLTKDLEVWKKIIVAFLPTALIGLVFYSLIKEYLLGNILITLVALFVGGIVLIALEKIYKEQDHHLDGISKLPLKKAALIGLFQSLAVIPGVSRSATTIFGGLFLGLKRKTAVEFSFLLALPTMAAATGLDLVKSNFTFTPQEVGLLIVGFIGAFITAFFSVKFLVTYVEKHTFIPFGIYRIVFSALFFLLIVN